MRVAIGIVLSRGSNPAIWLTAALNSRDQQYFCVRIEFTNQDIAFLGDVRCKPALRYLLVEFSFNFGKTLLRNGLGIPFGKCLVSTGTNHSEFLQCHDLSPSSRVKKVLPWECAIHLPDCLSALVIHKCNNLKLKPRRGNPGKEDS